VAVTDAQLFRFTNDPDVPLHPDNATRWLNEVIPSFNRHVLHRAFLGVNLWFASHAIESQLAHLDPGLVSDNM
jgi:hypothetical protein